MTSSLQIDLKMKLKLFKNSVNSIKKYFRFRFSIPPQTFFVKSVTFICAPGLLKDYNMSDSAQFSR